jgi:hypothetical protein
MNTSMGLNENQRSILTRWYNENVEKANDILFDCEMDIEEYILLKVCRINHFDTIDLAINNFIVNVLAKGK